MSKLLFLVFILLALTAASGPFVFSSLVPAPTLSGVSDSDKVKALCREIKKSYSDLHWEGDPCEGIHWKVGGQSVQGRPLIYAEFGNPNSENTSLILSTVHGDEITPLHLGIQIIQSLKKMKPEGLGDTRVVVAPLVNPDGFFSHPRTRMNARGVDVNRNFPTEDWKNRALVQWKVKEKSNRRRFPGERPRSEPETIFQEELIQKIKPQKILSIHSPLRRFEYDGPGTSSLPRLPVDFVKEALRLKTRLNAQSKGFFPGSLGNYGHERDLLVFTLELPSADPRKVNMYWEQFQPRIQTMIHFTVPKFSESQASSGSSKNASGS